MNEDEEEELWCSKWFRVTQEAKESPRSPGSYVGSWPGPRWGEGAPKVCSFEFISLTMGEEHGLRSQALHTHISLERQ